MTDHMSMLLVSFFRSLSHCKPSVQGVIPVSKTFFTYKVKKLLYLGSPGNADLISFRKKKVMLCKIENLIPSPIEHQFGALKVRLR